MWPFQYAKVNNENSIDDAVEQECDHTITKRWYRTMEKFQFLKWPVKFLLLAAILTCKFSILHNRPSALQLGGEMNGIIPNFSTEKRIFYRQTLHIRPQNIVINKRNKGPMDRPDASCAPSPTPSFSSPTNLPQAAPASSKPQITPRTRSRPPRTSRTLPALAVFHGLHCLMHLSSSMDKLVLQIRNKDFTLDESAVWHNGHCFNYLRNALLCRGDTTLEGQAQTPRFRDVPGTDGTGVVHVCRNCDEIGTFAEGARLLDAKEHF